MVSVRNLNKSCSWQSQHMSHMQQKVEDLGMSEPGSNSDSPLGVWLFSGISTLTQWYQSLWASGASHPGSSTSAVKAYLYSHDVTWQGHQTWNLSGLHSFAELSPYYDHRSVFCASAIVFAFAQAWAHDVFSYETKWSSSRCCNKFLLAVAGHRSGGLVQALSYCPMYQLDTVV